MNYYDELGVPPSATTAEIQQAYKALVRILHPDQQQDEKLRRLSDLQLRRLNEIVEVLSDSQKRREYNAGLNQRLPVIAPQPKFSLSDLRRMRVRIRISFHAGMLVWVLIAAILGASAIFWFREPDPIHPPPHRSSLRAANMKATPEPHEPPPTQLAASPLPAGSPTWNTRIEASPAPQAMPPLTGKWLYVPRSGEPNKSLYPPQYIEMQIQDRSGKVSGKYDARYIVTDRAISPEMTFHFEGKAGDRLLVLPWSSAYGSRGEMRLKRISGESIEVTWITTAFGRDRVLASGTAILYRAP